MTIAAVKRLRDEELLELLAAYGEEWVAAESIARSYNAQHRLGLYGRGEATARDALSAVGAGRILARLAGEGRCERQQSYMSHYRVFSA